MNLHRHWRFLLGALIGLGVVLAVDDRPLQRLLAGANVLFAFFLVSTWLVTRRMAPEVLRRHASQQDEGAVVIFLIALAAVAVSLAAIFDALSHGPAGGWHGIIALTSVPLGWVTLHTLFALHYAHLWYEPGDKTTDRHAGEEGGLDFGPDCDAPGMIEFLYYSFTIGMTAQTSDTTVTSTEMRRLTLWHGGISFLYNTVLIALAVNAGITAAAGR